MALHLATGWRYGLFRDEFYYLACANHLDWGYVDHPPLSVVVPAIGGRYGLPPAHSPHNSYYFWGPGRERPSVLIVIGWSTEEIASSWTQVEVAGRIESPYAMPFETGSPIHVCRGLKVPLETAWRRAKMFI